MTKLIKKTAEQEIEILPNARRIASIAQQYRAKNILAYDVRGLTVLTDCFVMCSVTSEPQLKAVYNGVRDGMKEIGVRPLRAEGEISGSWPLLDSGTSLVHVFLEPPYDFSDLGRLWAFPSYAVVAGGNGDGAALDLVFASAQANGVYLIPVLGNNWTDCDYWPLSLYPSGGQRKDLTGWYATGYQGAYDGYLTNYRQWVTDVVSRYGGHSTLVAWELINEPRENTAVLTDFFTDAIALVEAEDSGSAITLGCICHGEPGFNGEDYRTQHALAGVGFTTVHDYVTDAALPAGVASAAAYAVELGKPLIVGEMGRESLWDQAKIDMYRAKMRAAFDAGAVGYLFWAYNDDTPADSPNGYDFGHGSPVMEIFAEF